MTPGARIASVIELLDAIDSDAMPPIRSLINTFASVAMRDRETAGTSVATCMISSVIGHAWTGG